MKRKLLLAAGLLALLLVPFAIYLASRWNDIPPPDDSDLVLPVRKIDPSQNPYPSIRSLSLNSEEREAIGLAWKTVGMGEPLDESFLAAQLKKHSETLLQFDRFAAMTDWRQDQEMAVETELHYLNNWLTIARLQSLKGRQAARDGRFGDALDSGLSILRFAEGLHLAEGGIMHQMVSVTIGSIGIKTVLEAVETGKLSSDQLARLDQDLSALAFTPETFAQAYIVEYLTYRKVADDLAAGKVSIHELEPSASGTESAQPPGKFFYKRNKTVKLLADAFRSYVREAGLIRSEAPGDPIADVEAMRENSGGLYFSGNLIGRILFSIVIPASGKLSDSFAVMRVSLDLLRTRVAMERYRFEHGAWPADLGALVSDFLVAIPIDQMDGQPIRYSTADNVIYSVGDDFKDDHGIAPDKSGSLKSRKEIVIELTPGS